MPEDREEPRRVRPGDRFELGELLGGRVELEKPEPVPEPEQEPSERWALRAGRGLEQEGGGGGADS